MSASPAACAAFAATASAASFLTDSRARPTFRVLFLFWFDLELGLVLGLRFELECCIERWLEI